MASHRLPDEDRPRRAVPAWVTAPPESAVAGLEARPAPAAPAPVPESFPLTVSASAPEAVASAGTVPAPLAAPPLVGGAVVVPDYPPQEDLLPPAPTSPAVHTLPFDRAGATPAPVPPIDVAPRTAPARSVPAVPVVPAVPAVPAVPVVGQPRFSVPGLEHVVVEGAEPEPSGPIGYRTPARFAHQRPAAAPTRSFDAVIAAPTHTVPEIAPVAHPQGSAAHAALAPTPAAHASAAPAAAAPASAAPAPAAPASAAPAAGPAPTTGASSSAGAAARLQADDDAHADAGRSALVGVTPGAVLGAIAGLGTLGLAAWWFLAPATVHGVGLVLGLLAVALSVVILRNPAATWQRPIALLGAVLGGVGTLVLLWAVASAVLPLVGVTLPDVTGSGATPTLAP
ncbi:hypothetical protein [Curtobacterium pusillum]|uniref:hypothetical protein n=1 Tax=Curtobacterium pusillum TaxID=69373 RepID=UPI0011AAFBB2|nr:hypothetical protein [Curtobacterium pusillum]